MFVDASALTAMLIDEADARTLLARMQTHAVRITTPLAVWETVLAVSRNLGLELKAAEAAVEAFLALAQVTVEPVPAEVRGAAIDAFARYGKGRHPAALNFGDCFAYACAKARGVPLLYKGDDFAHTDIDPA
jgi:ribonuclease VapC